MWRAITIWYVFASIMFSGLALISGCGDSYYQDYDNGDNSQTYPDTKWEQAQPVVKRNCERCHKGEAFLTSVDVYLAKAKARVINGSMPPGGGLSSSDKAILVGVKK